MLPHFFKHYDPIASRYVIFDDGSDEPTLSILRAHPKVELRSFDRDRSKSLVTAMMDLSNNCWKQSREADWVAVIDIDEAVALPGRQSVHTYLGEMLRTGVTAIPAIGFEMVRRAPPPQLEDLDASVRLGSPSSYFNKLCFFRPDCIMDTNFHAGRHIAAPTGSVRYPTKDRMMMKHYKFVGIDRVAVRHMQSGARLATEDIEKGWGTHWLRSRQELEATFEELERLAIDVTLIENLDALAAGPLWWRDNQTNGHPLLA